MESVKGSVLFFILGDSKWTDLGLFEGAGMQIAETPSLTIEEYALQLDIILLSENG